MIPTPIKRMIRFTLLAVVVLVVLVALSEAAYWGSRPITNGVIDQWYLYGETNPQDHVTIHRGVDFPVVTGTQVYAVSDGVVVNLRQDIADGTNPYAWGNFVLIRHNQPSGQNAFVYSLYMHLQRQSVQVVTGTQVIAGQMIARSDNTGNSSGPHLHLQIDEVNDPDAQLYPSTTLSF